MTSRTSRPVSHVILAAFDAAGPLTAWEASAETDLPFIQVSRHIGALCQDGKLIRVGQRPRALPGRGRPEVIYERARHG